MAKLSADRYCKEGCVLFNDALSTFYLRAYGVGHLVNIHFDNERGNPLQPRHQILYPRDLFISKVPDMTALVTLLCQLCSTGLDIADRS